MASIPRNPAEIAENFVGAVGPLKLLGSGIGGVVFLSPDLRTAIKVHHTAEGYATEVEAYKRLARVGLTKVHGLTIPKLRAQAPNDRLIQMDFVSPPFLLDFAGALFRPPDFDPDVVSEWHSQIDRVFGRHAAIVYSVYDTLTRHGIYYMDFRPSKIKLEGLPEYDSAPDEEDDGV